MMRNRLRRVPTFLAGAFVVLGVICVSTSCKPTSTSNRRPQGESLSKSQSFDNALASINKMYEFDSEEAGHQAVFYFNTWLESQQPGAWQSDPLLETLPLPLRNAVELENVTRNKIIFRDTREIREALWLRDIARWAIELPSNDTLTEEWIGHVEKTQSPEHAETLRDVLRLFDWTIRNIQLVEPRPVAAPGMYPEFDAEIGAGYSQLPEDSVLLGQADVWERGMVFMGLLNQRRIPGAVLATHSGDSGDSADSADSGDSVDLWACAVKVGDEIFLLDPALGLPLTAFGEGRLLTLNDLVADPELFRTFDFGDEHRYAMDKADDLIALVAAQPFSLTRSATVMQSRMTGESRWVLDVDPSEIASQFTEHPAISEARLWEMPIRAAIFHRTNGIKVKTETASANERLRARYIFDEGPLSLARKLHIRGMFAKHDGGKPGALIYYRDLRQTEDAIADIANDRPLLQLMGIERDPLEPEEVFVGNVRAAQMLLLASREHASYFLGLVHFETGSFQTSANWLEQRTLEDFPDGQWRLGAAYNLARALERTGEWTRARQLLLLSESPQRHGDLLRAKLIRTEVGGE